MKRPMKLSDIECTGDRGHMWLDGDIARPGVYRFVCGRCCVLVYVTGKVGTCASRPTQVIQPTWVHRGD